MQWSKGEYATANNVQEDYVVLAGNGLPLRADDHGDSAGSATPLAGSSAGGVTTFAAEGLIERPSDVDWFGFASGAGTISFSVTPAARPANLDPLIELRDGAGNLLAGAKPVDALPATLSVVAPLAGTFYLTVQGVGKGDPAGTGCSDYGSLGQYAVAGSVPTASGQPPVAVASATPASGTVPLNVAFASAGSTDPDGSIVAYEWDFGDGSAVAGGPSAGHVYVGAGSCTALLKVIDDTGLSATRSLTISAQAPVVTLPMSVAGIGMSLKVARNGSGQATAAVTVRDGNGKAVPGASVSGSWSGVATGSASAVSGSTGIASLPSPKTKAGGTFAFTVTGVSLSGYSYQPELNVETSDAITR
ncbi:MAG: PKD domain-containing protein [Burkholderiales bacterium]|nr:PKD domain-containing protein [Burkholderiales bacterium]